MTCSFLQLAEEHHHRSGVVVTGPPRSARPQLPQLRRSHAALLCSDRQRAIDEALRGFLRGEICCYCCFGGDILGHDVHCLLVTEIIPQAVAAQHHEAA